MDPSSSSSSPSAAAGGGTAGGHSLGGRSVATSSEEVRRRRLEAFNYSSSSSSASSSAAAAAATAPASAASAAATAATTATTPLLHNPICDVVDDYDDDEDAALQAALALSLEQQPAPAPPPPPDREDPRVVVRAVPPQQESSNDDVSRDNAKTTTQRKEHHSPRTQQRGTTPEPPSPRAAAAAGVPLVVSRDDRDRARPSSSPSSSASVSESSMMSREAIAGFHEIMWDSTLTTVSDKSRWVRQAINVRTNAYQGVEPMTVDENHHPISAATAAGTAPPTPAATRTSSSTILQHVASSHLPWGLLQEHGGPCGVLAAVQAEILRYILFVVGDAGDNDNDNDDDDEENNNDIENVAPQQQLSSDLVETALANALAVILARAALAPPAFEDEQETQPTSTGEPAEGAGAPNKKISRKNGPACSVRIVLPKCSSIQAKEELTWQDLEPWEETGTSAATADSALMVHTIEVQQENSDSKNDGAIPPQNDDPCNNNTSSAAGLSPGSSNKRQKVNSAIGESRMDRLSAAVRAFLTTTTTASGASAAASANANSSSSAMPLDHFRRRGGVILLVMSLVASRGTDTLRSEFDDPAGTKLTSQFGHTGQELINLLLTGRAVSNVFDNTLRPSGDIACRGIQCRPATGYLTQLEALRYCEVGGYYKSPIHPIWVVGSTSHFTVLFGDADALKESKSDMLLEQCRRAFKGVEGGEENGFIAKESLGGVLQTLGIQLTGSSANDGAYGPEPKETNDPEAAVLTLAASLEVGGAGIILWDDFWKAVSRLMTGASLETVLAGDGGGEGGGGGDAAASSSFPPSLINLADDEPEPTTTAPLLLTNGEETKSSAMMAPAAAATTDGTGNATANTPTKKPPPPQPAAAAAAAAAETDEEMARRLHAEEWDGGMNALSEAATRVASPMQVDNAGGGGVAGAAMTDEELARKLQAEWDAELTTTTPTALSSDAHSDAGVRGSPVPLHDHPEQQPFAATNQAVEPVPQQIFAKSAGDTTDDDDPMMTAPLQMDSIPLDGEQIIEGVSGEDSKPAAKKNDSSRLDFEKYGDSFSLYHYNGLRGGVLTPFTVTRLSAEEAVGASIALRPGSGGGGGGALGSTHAAAGGGGGSGDLEDVMRTKWPSCRINWLGKDPPYID